MNDKHDESDVREIDCLEAIGHLYAYLDGELNETSQQKEIERHISHCRSCYSRAQMEKAINHRLKNLNDTSVPESLQNRVRDFMDKL